MLFQKFRIIQKIQNFPKILLFKKDQIFRRIFDFLKKIQIFSDDFLVIFLQKANWLHSLSSLFDLQHMLTSLAAGKKLTILTKHWPNNRVQPRGIIR